MEVEQDQNLSKIITFHDELKENIKDVYHKNKAKEFHGTYTRFDEQGQLLREMNFKNGVLDGLQKHYRDGKLYQSENQIMGKNEGELILYFLDGTPKQIQIWKDNKKHGKSRIFHLNGSQRGEGTRENGEKIGIWQWNYTNEQISFIVDHSNKDKCQLYAITGDLVYKGQRTQRIADISDMLESDQQQESEIFIYKDREGSCDIYFYQIKQLCNVQQ